MKSSTTSSGDIDRLPLSERRLVEQVTHSCTHDDEAGFLAIAEHRLRNIVEKYSEELKRARLALRSGAPGQAIADLQSRVVICTRALEICRKKLTAIDENG